MHADEVGVGLLEVRDLFAVHALELDALRRPRLDEGVELLDGVGAVLLLRLLVAAVRRLGVHAADRDVGGHQLDVVAAPLRDRRVPRPVAAQALDRVHGRAVVGLALRRVSLQLALVHRHGHHQLAGVGNRRHAREIGIGQEVVERDAGRVEVAAGHEHLGLAQVGLRLELVISGLLLRERLRHGLGLREGLVRQRPFLRLQEHLGRADVVLRRVFALAVVQHVAVGLARQVEHLLALGANGVVVAGERRRVVQQGLRQHRHGNARLGRAREVLLQALQGLLALVERVDRAVVEAELEVRVLRIASLRIGRDVLLEVLVLLRAVFGHLLFGIGPAAVAVGERVKRALVQVLRLLETLLVALDLGILHQLEGLLRQRIEAVDADLELLLAGLGLLLRRRQQRLAGRRRVLLKLLGLRQEVLALLGVRRLLRVLAQLRGVDRGTGLPLVRLGLLALRDPKRRHAELLVQARDVQFALEALERLVRLVDGLRVGLEVGDGLLRVAQQLIAVARIAQRVRIGLRHAVTEILLVGRLDDAVPLERLANVRTVLGDELLLELRALGLLPRPNLRGVVGGDLQGLLVGAQRLGIVGRDRTKRAVLVDVDRHLLGLETETERRARGLRVIEIVPQERLVERLGAIRPLRRLLARGQAQHRAAGVDHVHLVDLDHPNAAEAVRQMTFDRRSQVEERRLALAFRLAVREVEIAGGDVLKRADRQVLLRVVAERDVVVGDRALPVVLRELLLRAVELSLHDLTLLLGRLVHLRDRAVALEHERVDLLPETARLRRPHGLREAQVHVDDVVERALAVALLAARADLRAEEKRLDPLLVGFLLLGLLLGLLPVLVGQEVAALRHRRLAQPAEASRRVCPDELVVNLLQVVLVVPDHRLRLLDAAAQQLVVGLHRNRAAEVHHAVVAVQQLADVLLRRSQLRLARPRIRLVGRQAQPQVGCLAGRGAPQAVVLVVLGVQVRLEHLVHLRRLAALAAADEEIDAVVDGVAHQRREFLARLLVRLEERVVDLGTLLALVVRVVVVRELKTRGPVLRPRLVGQGVQTLLRLREVALQQQAADFQREEARLALGPPGDGRNHHIAGKVRKAPVEQFADVPDLQLELLVGLGHIRFTRSSGLLGLRLRHQKTRHRQRRAPENCHSLETHDD